MTGTLYKYYITIILKPGNINPGHYSAVKKNIYMWPVYIYTSKCEKLWCSTNKCSSKTICEISLFSNNYFNHYDHCYHYHYHCHDYHHYHHHGHYYYNGHFYHYDHCCYHYNEYHQYYHHYQDYHYQHYYHYLEYH